ncbi:MAG: cell division protein FtsA, partial [Bacteroidales bacterium]
MSAEEIVVGLDIGTTKIAVMVGRKDESGKIDILGYGQAESIGVMRGSVINVDKTAESIKIATEAAQLLSGVEIHEVYVGIAGQHIKSRQHRGSVIREH